MEPARVRFLEEGEEPVLPKWTKLLPQRWRQRKTVDTYPYTLTRVDGVLTGILQAERTAVLTADWRRGAVRLLAALEEAGAAIIVPPAEGEFPRERLPFAEGRRLAQLFAFAGAAEALRRQGRNPEESAFLLAGGESHIWGRVLSSLGNEVNRLAFFTQEPETAEGVVQRLYAERGLMAEVFSSPKNAALGAADVVLSCGMEQRAYEHILTRGCIVVARRDLHGGAVTDRDAVGAQLSARGRVDVVADLLAARRRRGDLKLRREPLLTHHFLEQILRHRAAADIAVANK